MISCFKCSSIDVYKMNNIVDKFTLAGYKFMSKMQLKQPVFAYCERFTKHKKKNSKI